MKLTPQQIEQIAILARLELTEKEKKLYAEQLSVVLDYISMLNEVDTEGVSETCQVTGLEDVVREDKAQACAEEIKNKLINTFPEKMACLAVRLGSTESRRESRRGKLLKVKAVFNDEAE